MHIDLAFESISPWAGSDPVKIEWARGSTRRGSLGPFRPTGGGFPQVKIDQTISIPVTLFHVRCSAPLWLRPRSWIASTGLAYAHLRPAHGARRGKSRGHPGRGEEFEGTREAREEGRV